MLLAHCVGLRYYNLKRCTECKINKEYETCTCYRILTDKIKYYVLNKLRNENI